MLILCLLVVPACLGAPPGDPHSVYPQTACTKNYCRVSNDTLDSALETFLCMNKDDIRGLQTEKEKKLLLAQKIAPLLTMEDGSSLVEDDLSKMDTARLVPLVNLVLHDGAAAGEPKTELEYSRALQEGLAAATSLHPSLYRRASPIVLGFLNCQTKLLSGLHSLLIGSRNGKILPNLFGNDGLFAEGAQKLVALIQGVKKFSQTTMAPTTTAPTTTAACSSTDELQSGCNCENSQTREAVPCTKGQFCRDGKCLNVCDIGPERLDADCFCKSGSGGGPCLKDMTCRDEGCQDNILFLG